ncbi:MAG: prepilin peptidase [Bacillota bacterium]
MADQDLALLIGCLLPISICVYTDFKSFTLPNWLTAFIAFGGLATAVLLGRTPDALLGAVLTGGLFVVTGLLGDVGGGDIKLAFGIGMWFGWYGGYAVILIGCLLGILWNMPKILKSGIKNVRLPLGAFMGIAAWVYVLVFIK